MKNWVGKNAHWCRSWEISLLAGGPPSWAVYVALWVWEGLQALITWLQGLSTSRIGIERVTAYPESLERGLGHLRGGLQWWQSTQCASSFRREPCLQESSVDAGGHRLPSLCGRMGEMGTSCQFPWGQSPTEEKRKTGWNESAWSVQMMLSFSD